MQQEPITKKSYDNLVNKIEHIKLVQKPQILKSIETARELGDLKENAEYHSAKEEQANLEKQLDRLGEILLNIEIVDITKLNHDKINFGSKAKLLNLDINKEITYSIVNSTDSDPAIGYISYNSPFAKAIIGKKVGDEIEIRLPSGVNDFKILSIELDNSYA
jgi:transcription elongation factor GreA